MQNNEEYVLKVLEEGGLITRRHIDGARSLLNGEPGVVDVLIDDGVVSDVDVSRTLAAQAHMDWIDIASMVIARLPSRSAQPTAFSVRMGAPGAGSRIARGCF